MDDSDQQEVDNQGCYSYTLLGLVFSSLLKVTLLYVVHASMAL